MSVICEPLWNDSGANLDESQWFENHSEVILEWISVIHEPLWNDSGANHGHSQTILKWFWGESLWFANHYEMIMGESQWFVNHSEMILGQIMVIHKPFLKWFWGEYWWTLVICEPFWNDSGANLSDSQTFLKWFMNHWESSQIITNHTWWERGELIFQNIQDVWGCTRIL